MPPRCYLPPSKSLSKRHAQPTEAALALDPRSEAAHLQLWQIFLGHHTPRAAADIFTDALALHPDSFLLRLGRGLAYKDCPRAPRRG